MSSKTKPIADRIFDAVAAAADLEQQLDDELVPFDKLSWDHYDRSLTLHNVKDEYRLTVEAQKLIYIAGFVKVFLHHANNWETHYTFDSVKPLGPFEEVRGWRVSYPHKRGGTAKEIWIEEDIPGWPKEWFTSGYAIVKKPIQPTKQEDLNARIYPCMRCGTLRSKAEGGTTFTVCDECWDLPATEKP